MLPTPPASVESLPLEAKSPNHAEYYSLHLNKSQFNLVLITCAVNLLQVLYDDSKVDGGHSKVRFFVVELLRRLKTLIQLLQVACWYLVKLVQRRDGDDLPADPRKLFLGCIILALKFNQDYNYSFKLWLKICGMGASSTDSESFDVAQLRALERQVLKLLGFNCYLNGRKYENWCNILLIFGYDFIHTHNVATGTIDWEPVVIVGEKLKKWRRFFTHSFNPQTLELVKVDFRSYYQQQMGSKVVLKGSPSLFTSSTKRCRDEIVTLLTAKRRCVQH